MAMGSGTQPPVVLTIAGFDPTAGAGLSADLKTFAAHGCYGVAALTSLALQDTGKVHAVEPVKPEVLRQQLEQLLSDFSIAAVKIGMLATRAHVRVVAEVLEKVLEKKKLSPVVLDPVLRSTSGAELLDAKGTEELRSRLLKLARVVTPNRWEAGVLTGMEVRNRDALQAAAQKLQEMGARAVVITGGGEEKPVDLFYDFNDGESFTEFAGEKVRSENTHGTGCAFSSALAANLAHGRALADSVVLAKAYVTEAIKKGHALGKGKGLLNHFYRSEAGDVVHSRSIHTPEEGPAHPIKHF
jgi:hydroxymethylpyrimidine/phosphomethylpyrimidine kinase